jgi:hypothetical protein
MFASIPRFVVIAAAIFFALTSANSADAACSLKCLSCQKACYATYEKEISEKAFGVNTAIFKEQYKQCRLRCQKK